jgi:hypothetical protein
MHVVVEIHTGISLQDIFQWVSSMSVIYLKYNVLE